MRYVLDLVERIFGNGRRNFNSADPAGSAEKRLRAGIRYFHSIHVNEVIVKAFNNGRRRNGPETVRVLGQIHLWGLGAAAADHGLNLLCIGRLDAQRDATIRVDAWKLSGYDIG